MADSQNINAERHAVLTDSFVPRLAGSYCCCRLWHPATWSMQPPGSARLAEVAVATDSLYAWMPYVLLTANSTLWENCVTTSMYPLMMPTESTRRPIEPPEVPGLHLLAWLFRMVARAGAKCPPL